MFENAARNEIIDKNPMRYKYETSAREGKKVVLQDADLFEFIAGLDVLKGEYIGCHPCVCTSSLKILTKDIIERFLPATGHTYQTVCLKGEDAE